MKRNLKKVVAATLAMTMCVPAMVFAADSTSGSFTTSFNIYSPTLTVEVPVNLDVEVNPFADTTATDTKKFEVASKSIDIINGSVDLENDQGIPVVATIKAKITSKGEDVITEYNTFSPNNTSTTKKIYLQLSEGSGAEVIVNPGDSTANPVIPAGTPAYSNEKLDLSQYIFDSTKKANYASPTNKTAITQYGSLLSLDIAKPGLDTGKTSYKTAADVKPTVGSFAVTGVANTNADWKPTDIGVSVTYDIKASKALTITTPTVAGVTHTSGSSATDLDITVSGIGEATVAAMAVHNDGGYGDAIWESDKFTTDYSTAGTVKITLSKDDTILGVLAGDDYKTKAQDLVIVLSDGRYVVTTLTVN